MAKINYFLLCESLLRDEKERITLVNIFDTLTADKLPVVPLRFTVAFNLSLEDEDVVDGFVNLKVEVTDSKNKPLGFAEGKAKVINPNRSLVTSLDLGGKIILNSFQTHKIRLYVKNKLLKELELRVVKGDEDK